MEKRVVAIDVETPNHRNDRICAIGWVVKENGQVIRQVYHLINPECEFDSKNSMIHGIYPKDVCRKPIFPEIWDPLMHELQSGLVLAHNASFDLNVLSKTLSAYQLDAPIIDYVDTCFLAKTICKDVPNCRLDTLCEQMGIELTHHHADSDAEACLAVFENLAQREDINPFIRTYSFERIDDISIKRTGLKEETAAIQALQGVLKNITEDGVLTTDEITFLTYWLEQHQQLNGQYPYDKIFSTVSAALEDGVLEPDELQKMEQLFEQLSNPVSAFSCEETDFSIHGKTFCLTGEFNFGTRNQVEERLLYLGGIQHKGVTQKTDYVIVGNMESQAWSMGNYGTKIKKALEMQTKGNPITIIKEENCSLLK